MPNMQSMCLWSFILVHGGADQLYILSENQISTPLPHPYSAQTKYYRGLGSHVQGAYLIRVLSWTYIPGRKT